MQAQLSECNASSAQAGEVSTSGISAFEAQAIEDLVLGLEIDGKVDRHTDYQGECSLLVSSRRDTPAWAFHLTHSVNGFTVADVSDDGYLVLFHAESFTGAILRLRAELRSYRAAAQPFEARALQEVYA